MEVMRRLWSEPVVDFTGSRLHRIDRACILPLAEHRQIPVWFGWLERPGPSSGGQVLLGEGVRSFRAGP